MSEMKIELLEDRCKDCPRLSLETVQTLKTHHRCKHLQFCREVLGFWKAGHKIDELKLDFVSKDELKKLRPAEVMAPDLASPQKLKFGDEE